MKVTIPEISWHNRDPILALDVQPNPPDGIYRLATAGTDTHVVIWQLKILDNGAISVEALSDLTRHNRAVNAVRFSPDGELLASADDEAAIILWKRQDSGGETDIFADEPEKENKEHWVIHKMLRGHLEDVYDICWSKCSQFLVSGSVDNTAMLWDVGKGKHISILNEHKGFVQGVAWDPLNQYVATLCSDRCCRIYNFGTKKIVNRIDKASLPVTDAEDNVTEKSTRLFYDDTLKSFCRRLAFSPDGEILITPSGIVEGEDGKTTNVSYIFSRYSLSKPALYLPTKDKYTLAVRFSPVLYELKPLIKEQESKEESKENKKESKENKEESKENKEECKENKEESKENKEESKEINKEESKEGQGECSEEDWRKYSNLLDLPYRMVFAIATQNALFLYDTQQPVPFAKISNMHYTRLSDITWSSDGRILVVSSTDGYCSLVSFSEGELGTPYKKIEVTPQKSGIEGDTKLAEDVEMSSIESPGNKKKPNNSSTPKNDRVNKLTPKPIAVKRISSSNKAGKRISLTTLSEPSNKKTETSSCSKTDEMEIDSETQGKQKGVEKPEESPCPDKKNATDSITRTPTRSVKSARHIALTTLSSSKEKKSSIDKDSLVSEVENQSPSKRTKDVLSPKRTPSSSQKTSRRIPLTTVSSPKSKGASLTDKASPAKAPVSRRLPLSAVSSPVVKKGAEEMELDEEVTKRFEGDALSPPKTIRNISPAKTPTSASKTTRRVPLITLSSPKAKKNLSGNGR